MRIQLSLKDPNTGRWRIVRCGCCKEPRIFNSWKAAKEHAHSLGHHTFRSTRVTANKKWSPKNPARGPVTA